MTTKNSKFLSKKTAIIAIGAAGVIISSAVLVALVVPSPVSAFGPRAFWMHGAGHPGAFASWHSGHGAPWSNQMAESNANWTGSIPMESINSDVIGVIKEKVNVSVSDAESTAVQSLGNQSRVCCVMLAPANGYLVYMVYGIDGSNKMHQIVIDAGDGKILDSMEVEKMWNYAGGQMPLSSGPWNSSGFGGGAWH